MNLSSKYSISAYKKKTYFIFTNFNILTWFLIKLLVYFRWDDELKFFNVLAIHSPKIRSEQDLAKFVQAKLFFFSLYMLRFQANPAKMTEKKAFYFDRCLIGFQIQRFNEPSSILTTQDRNKRNITLKCYGIDSRTSFQCLTCICVYVCARKGIAFRDNR